MQQQLSTEFSSCCDKNAPGFIYSLVDNINFTQTFELLILKHKVVQSVKKEHQLIGDHSCFYS